MTILRLWDSAAESTTPVNDLRRRLDAFRVPPFYVEFNRLRRHGKYVHLVSGRHLAEAKTLRQLLVDHLIDRGGLPVRRPGKLRPHVTLHYNNQGEPLDEWIAPIGWRVEELILIESVVGETRHITHGRWPLKSGDSSALELSLPLFATRISWLTAT